MRSGTAVTVLGASGFLGSAVAARLAGTDVRLRLVARRPCLVPAPHRHPVEVRQADLTRPGQVADAVGDADVVICLVLAAHGGSWRVPAGQEDAAEQVNVGVVRDLVDVLSHRAPRDGRRPTVVLTGSTSQVGPTAAAMLDGTETDRPATVYDRQKLRAERLLLAADHDDVLDAVALRLPTVYGPPHGADAPDRGVVSSMVRRAMAGQPLTVWGDGSTERDLLLLDDVVEAVVAGVEHAPRLGGRPWLLGTGSGVPLRRLFTTVADAVAARTGAAPVPVVPVPVPPHASEMDLQSLVADPRPYEAVTGWRARVGLDEGVRRTVDRLVAAQEQAAEHVGTAP